MTKSTLISAILALSMGVSSIVWAEASLQNSEKTADYFNQELSFKITPHDLHQLLSHRGQDFVIVDVRDAKSYTQGHIPGAINLPQENYHHFEGSETSFPGLRKDVYNYVYCYAPSCDLAAIAARKFASLGYPVKEVIGGYNGWKDEGHPVER